MSKVIVERPRIRTYAKDGLKNGRRVDPDLMLKNQGMRAPHIQRGGAKSLNENLSPLVRFLESRTGKNWDDVYSEISKNLRVDNAVQQHVRDHLRDFVATRVVVKNQTLFYSGWWGGLQPLENSYIRFYVDPVDNILKKNHSRRNWNASYRERREADLAAANAKVHVAANGTEYREVDGIWYRVVWDVVPEPHVIRVTSPDGTVTERVYRPSKTDIFTNHSHKSGERYRAGKEQASRTELRQNNLVNQPKNI